MNNTALVTRAQPRVLIRGRQAVVEATLVILLAASLVSAQTSPIAQPPRPSLPETELAFPGSAGAIIPSFGYVDGRSTCRFRTGDRDCSPDRGPFRKVGEGIRGVSLGGTLFIRGGFYSEPILLNRNMVIRAYDSTVTIGPPSLAPFDLVGDAVDDNALSLNPKWGAQRIDPSALPNPQLCPRRDPGSYPCTNQFTYQDSGWFGCGPHINWFGATYEGKVYWQDHSSDDDYNIKLTREDRAGYTTAHADHILCEFDSDETIDHFSTPWWSRFHRAVDESDARARQMIDGSFAIATGLVGLDCEHDCWSELHPVWALAMNVQPSLDDDLWAIFVRNWGNEGFCGTSQHFIDFPNNTYTFRLPWKPGAAFVMATDQSVGHAYHIQSPSWTVRGVPGQEVFVTFTLNEPRGDGSMWDAELHLRWIGAGAMAEPRAERPEFAESPEPEENEYMEAPKKKAQGKVEPEGIIVRPQL